MAIKDNSKSSSNSAVGKFEGLKAPAYSKQNQVICNEPNSSNSAVVQSPGSSLSTLDPVLLPLQDPQQANAVGAIRREVGSQRTDAEQIPSNFDKRKSNSGENFVHSQSKFIFMGNLMILNLVNSFCHVMSNLKAVNSDSGNAIVQGKLPSKVHVVGKNYHLESSQNATSVHSSSSVSRPSSNYNNRSQVIGPQKGNCNFATLLSNFMLFLLISKSYMQLLQWHYVYSH